MLTIIDTSLTIHKVKTAIYSQDMINDLNTTEVFCPNCRLMNMWDSSEGAEQPDEVCTRLVGLPVETCAQLWIDSPLWRLQAPASSLQLAAGGPGQRRRRRRARHAAAAGLHLSPSASSVSLSCLSDAHVCTPPAWGHLPMWWNKDEILSITCWRHYIKFMLCLIVTSHPEWIRT